ncbi:hypothetical protein [Nostoc parmelioides]|uniref:Outer membrane protein beta-barrel domain-containing protein n=1 Tax=Nostoc parmelioides FACHB-3921 TaxID=2692909 RepID=A0ABR8BCQ4_9NOSO|nr:hypothetical protein [Nostoc parmelioides]MBD2251565.1 hypothetical protein [Nostoc parmelioides FACHB-3921]
MNKIQTNINTGDFTSPFLGTNYTFWNVGTRLITLLLIFTAISHKSAVAADNIATEDQQPELSNYQKPQDFFTASKVNSQTNLNLKQRLLAHQKSRQMAQSETIKINDGFTANVAPETFSNSFPETTFSPIVQNDLVTEDNSQHNLFISPVSNPELLTEKQANISQNLQSPIIAQIDSSETVGDTFGDTNKLRQELLIEPIIKPREASKASPGSTAGTPSAYGASFGQAYIGGGLFFPLEDNKDRVDGSLSVGFGLGDSAKSVGLEVNVNITSVGGGDTFDFGDSGGVGFKLHRYLGDGTAVAVGWSNAIKWGDVSSSKDTIYGVVTRAFPLQPKNSNNQLPLTISVGLGSGAFRSKGAIDANENPANLFASLGLRVIPQVSLVSSWTGNRLNMGASFAPFKKIPIVINAVFTDVTSNFNSGLGFSLSAGYSFRF